ncbi:hypothetical protein ABID22_000597 [Pontibacter aydingkolensis]|uniref:DUF4957 domain-containing protein n=1 Tax=Pontibacter aydingkolensis TaxID=1911536 RepID=A0ABS7CRP7_9BACT|nr:DUF4957 domain-containing protein [Pontibacter aydingkolensis]MBW7466524.1 DUF4957 domain-containing protein [Pontibacter aydingkolensis]
MKKRYNNTVLTGLFLTLLVSFTTISCKDDKAMEEFQPERVFTPVNVRATNGETQAVILWNPSLFTQGKGATYTVEVSKDQEFSVIAFTMQTDTARAVITDENVEIKQPYFARIRANALGTAAPSNWIISPEFRITGEQIFTAVNSPDVKDKSVVLRWRQTAGLTKIVLTTAGGVVTEHPIIADEIAAREKNITGLTPNTLYTAEIFAGTKNKGTVTFTTKEPSAFTVTVATAEELIVAIENAATGDVIGLEQGVYDISENRTMITSKHLTIQSVSGNPANTTVHFKEITLKGSGAGVKLSGIAFDGTKGNADYFLNLTGLNSDGEAADFTSILVENCTVKYTNNCFMRANRASANGHKIESITVRNTVASVNGTGSYHYFMIDKLEFKKLEIENSTIYNSGRALISWATNMSVPAKPTITINQTTINNFGFSGRNNILMDANANAINYTLQNSIVANAPKDGTVGTSLLRASTDGSSNITVNNNNFFKLVDGSATPVELTFPAYVQLVNNKSIDLGWTGSTTNFSLPTNPEIRTASTTNGPIGDPRWW